MNSSDQKITRNVDVRASMMLKDLCSYPWVRDTYGDHLPDAAWIIKPRTPIAPAKAGN